MNSYHDGYKWSNDTKQGVEDILDESLVDYRMRIEHMDSKNISSDDFMNVLFELYQYKYDRNEFDIIICADDNALKFLLKYGNELFGNTPIFFCGVNTLTTHNFDQADNFAGVVEKHSIVDTSKVALDLNPELENIFLIVTRIFVRRVSCFSPFTASFAQ